MDDQSYEGLFDTDGHSQMRVGNSAARNLTERLSHHRPTCRTAQANIFLLARQVRKAGQLQGVLGQAPLPFQVLLRVCWSLPGPPRWGQAPLWPERQVLEGEISDAVVVFARAPRRLHFAGGASIRVRRATHLSTPLNITRKHDQIESSDEFHPPS